MDTAREGAGRLVKHANRPGCCLKLDSGRSQDQIRRHFLILKFIARQTANRGIRESMKQRRRRRTSHEAQEASAEASTTGLASTCMISRGNTCCYLFPQSPILVGRERVCVWKRSERVVLRSPKQKNSKAGNINKFNIIDKHMRIKDRGNEISFDYHPD